MKFETVAETSEVNHDPLGPEVQVHELEDGGAVLTFSDSLIEQLGWEIGDVVEWEVTDAGISISNKRIEDKKKEDAKLP